MQQAGGVARDHADLEGNDKDFGFPRATWEATQRVLSVDSGLAF